MTRILALKGLVGGAALLPLAAIVAPHPAILPRDWATLAFLAFGCLGGAILFFYLALPRIGATLTASLNVSGSAVVGVLAAYLLRHEPVGALQAAAAVVLVGGVLLVARGDRLHASHASPPERSPPVAQR